MEPNKVMQALKVLQDEGREDLIKEGVLEEAWVGLRRPKRLSADGVTAAIISCTSPERVNKKFKSKSFMGRKVTRLPEKVSEVEEDVSGGLPAVRLQQRGGGRFSSCSGASLTQRVAAGGRGSGSSSAVSVGSRMGEQACREHARSGPHAGRIRKQAQSSLERA
ncbi:hypothetical protein NDU88_003225 [Pleurodeles waltl]|uniref:Uncharacterized protein n=1 Tax=Pleurodeles waltl TaxID=8319 RepID=A0AAV7MR09_PLEWA|nr:hypothetical protein NDU88_003225 [Pleurodeles waltl]